MRSIYGDITKVVENDDGTLTVSGIASTEAVDSDGEIITAEAMRAAIPDYMKFGAVREMHGSVAAGTALKCFVDDAGKTQLEAVVVDAGSIKKLLHGVLKGFSIGGKVLSREPGNSKTITGIGLREISLVDRPANPEAMISLCKMEDGMEPENVEAVEAVEIVAKGEEVYDAEWALNALEIIQGLLAKEQGEPSEDAGQVASLKAAITAIKAFVASEIVEENPEPAEMVEMAESIEDLEKAGAKYSKATAKALKALKSKAAELAECMKAFDDMAEDEEEEEKHICTCDLHKSELLSNPEQFEKFDELEKVSAERDGLVKKLETLENDLQKAKAKVAEKPLRAVVAVAKEDEGKTEVTKATSTDPLELMKMVHQSGGRNSLNRLA